MHPTRAGYIWIQDGEIKYHIARFYKDQVNWAKMRLLQVFGNPDAEDSRKVEFNPSYLTDEELTAAKDEYMRRVRPKILKEYNRMNQRRFQARRRAREAQHNNEDSDGI